MPRGWWPLALVVLVGCGGSPRQRTEEEASRLRVALHTEPQTWNRLLAPDWVTHVVTDQIHEPLLRIDPETQELEPALAESWEYSEDGRRLVFHLRPGVRFSDGEPFSARDVAFTFRALYDPAVASPLLETALVGGEELGVEVIDDLTVAFVLPARTAALERAFDSIAILPAHRLEESLEREALAAETGLGAPPSSIVVLGPFRPSEHLPGERIVLERNPHYWRAPLPRLQGIVFEILPDPSARLLWFRAGKIDVLEPISPEAFESLERDSPDELELVDVGPSMISERLWFNLNPKSPIEEHKKRWFRDPRFRRAISLAIDRQGLSRLVYRGRATPSAGPTSPANRFWRDSSIPPTKQDLEGARALLSEAGFRWSDEGRLCGPEGRPVTFAIVIKTGSDLHARAGAFLQADLEAVGIEARVVPVEASGLFHRLTGSFDYEACLLSITQTDPDPSAETAFWLSRSQLHLWHPRQSEPATEWEARIDALMEAQTSELDVERRRDLFRKVQRIVARELPVIDLVVPHALVGVHRRVQNFRPTPFTHSLWNASELEVEPVARLE